MLAFKISYDFENLKDRKIYLLELFMWILRVDMNFKVLWAL